MIGRGNCEKADDWLGREPGQASGTGAEEDVILMWLLSNLVYSRWDRRY